MDTLSLIKKYSPFNMQETSERDIMLDVLCGEPDCFLREAVKGHFTASSWIVNKDFTKVLFCYHRIYDSWSWVGGHADGDTDLLRVALKEAREETGVLPVEIYPDIFSLEILPVSGHIKKGEYVPSHLHYNLTFLIVADENAPVRIKPDENTGVKWISLEDIKNASTEKWMIETVYNKLISKTREIPKGR